MWTRGRSDSHFRITLSDLNATVTVIQYGDYQCPYCEAFFQNTWPQLKAEYVDTGKIRFSFQDYAFRSERDGHRDPIRRLSVPVLRGLLPEHVAAVEGGVCGHGEDPILISGLRFQI